MAKIVGTPGLWGMLSRYGPERVLRDVGWYVHFALLDFHLPKGEASRAKRKYLEVLRKALYVR